MIQHYFKVAFRNLWKYKGQTLISVLGLAVGFACFAIATLWIRYEMTYDSFHKNADRIYCVYRSEEINPNGMSQQNPYPLAEYLRKTFPEIASVTAISPSRFYGSTVEYEDVEYPAKAIGVDTSFFSMFNVKIVEGSMDFIRGRGRGKMAVTREKALQMFGNDSPVGKRVKMHGNEYSIEAVVTGFPKHSNYPFDFIMTASGGSSWGYFNRHILVELVPEIDMEAFRKKLYEHTIQDENAYSKNLSVLPLTSIRYKDLNIEREVKFQHIVIFSVAGLLLILCTLFNYLTLFISRFRVRQREFALRIVCGASNRSLFTLLSVEFLVSMFMALLLGLFLIDAVAPVFIKLSGVKMEWKSIYIELLTYIAGIILIALLTFLLTLAVFRRRALNLAIRSGNRKLFRKISISVQLIVSIGFAFCTVIILKQMYHLHNTDLGFAFKNRGAIVMQPQDRDNIAALENTIKQIPEITETVKGINPVLPFTLIAILTVRGWDDKQTGNNEEISLCLSSISKEFQEFYELKLAEGEFLTDNDEENLVMINESAAKAFGWNKAVGKSFRNKYKVKGVIKNIYNAAPTADAKPFFYTYSTWRDATDIYENPHEPAALFKYHEGTWNSCRKKIEEAVRKEFPNMSYKLSNAEEEYDMFLKSENTLLAILTVISLVCMLVCVFGFVSIVSLTCEERRKEIAIRKINGATIKDILDIFFKEYLTLLVVGAVIAFPVGYLIMKRWLESYVVQTEMSAWVYVSILLALMLAIVICVGGRVYKTSRENPINAINR